MILFLFGLVCAWLVPGIGQLRHDDDVLAFLPPDHPDVVSFRRVADRFGMLEVSLVGLRADGDDLLVPERTEEIRALAETVATLPGVRLVLAYPSLPDPKVEGETLVVEALVPKGLDDAEEIRRRALANPNAVGNLISKDGTAAALLVYLVQGEEHRARRAEVLATIRETVEATWSGQAYFGGSPFIEDTAARASRADIERLSPVVIGVLVVASAALLGSLTGAVLNLIVTGLGVALVVGAHGRFGEPFTIVSSTTPVMMVALGGAFGMHMISGYQRQEGTARARAAAALRELWIPVVLSGVTTAASFFALIVMPQAPMKRFGVVAGFGVLLLLVLALLVLPALLSSLPARWLRHRASQPLPLKVLPPLWLLVALAVVGIGLGSRLRADPDTGNVFDASSDPGQADQFFEDHFGGSQYVQLAIEADLTEPTVLRRIRDLADDLASVDGVVDVRTLVEPVEMLTEGFGGRRGIPENVAQARRVITNLADQTPMAQLMTPDGRGAIMHVKLAPLPSERLLEVTAAIRAIVGALPEGPIRVGSVDAPAVAQARAEEIHRRLARIVNQEISAERLQALLAEGEAGPALLDEVRRLRDRALGTDEVVEPVPPKEFEAIEPHALLEPRGEALEALLTARLPTLVQNDPAGIKYAAEQLGTWIDEAKARHRVDALCDAFGLSREDPDAPEEPEPSRDDPVAGMFDDADAPPPPPGGPCGALAEVLSELGDDTWAIPPGVDAPALREVPFSLEVTGQPIIGEAFAQSVTTSLWASTLVSLVALALVLVLARQVVALVPATWTLAVTTGIISLLGHPIGVGTSMVACIALGAGVDFAIHLGIRARRSTAPHPGRDAVDALGVVILITGLQLALAFIVLVASEMPPLRQFGVGLAIGLLGAAAGAVWLTPRLYRARS